MQIFGNFKTYKLSPTDGSASEQDISSDIETEKLIKIRSDSDSVYLLLTPSSSSTDADADDFLLSSGEESEFLVGRGLDRISVYNASGGVANIHMAVLY